MRKYLPQRQYHPKYRGYGFQRGYGGAVSRIGAKHTIQFIDKFLLYIAGPETSNEGTDSRHGILACQCSGKVGGAPCLSAADGRGHIHLAGDFSSGQVGAFHHVFRVTSQIFEKRHVMHRGRFTCEAVKLRRVRDNATLEQCGKLHGFLHRVRRKQFWDDNVC